jgi:hypothetical protein
MSVPHLSPEHRRPVLSQSSERPWYKKKRWVIPLGFFALCIVVAPFTEDSSDTAANDASVQIKDTMAPPVQAANEPAAVETTQATKAKLVPAARPKLTQEQRFVALVEDARDNANNADNDFQRRLPLTKRNKAICKLLDGKKVKNWTGEVSKLDTNGDGLGVLEIVIADGIKVSTWNNAFSDFEDHTLIKTSSPVFDAMSSLNEGDRVRFTGTFTRDSANCIGEQSLTDHGSTQTPTFTMRFGSLSTVS